MQVELERVLGSLAGQQTRDGFAAALSAAVAGHGLDVFTYLGVRLRRYPRTPSDTPFFISTYPPEWIRRYDEQHYVHVDPVVSLGLGAARPFYWSEAMARGAGQRGRQLFAEAASFGIRQGVTLPVHGPAGDFAMITFASNERDGRYARELKDSMWLLQAISLAAHDAIGRHLLGEGTAGSAITLTPRERECLVWTAAGKSAWEVAQILSRSVDVVNFHLKNAARKLGVYGKHHAVVKAMMLGLISP